MANLKDMGGRVVNTLHRTLFTTTQGRLGGKVMGMPVVELITTGRKSGQPRSTMLTSPVQEGDNVVLVASWGGDDRNPLWFRNLQANPDVEIVMGGHRRKMRARVATTEERARLWPQITQRYKGYAGYQTKTDREIPVVICERA